MKAFQGEPKALANLFEKAREERQQHSTTATNGSNDTAAQASEQTTTPYMDEDTETTTGSKRKVDFASTPSNKKLRKQAEQLQQHERKVQAVKDVLGAGQIEHIRGTKPAKIRHILALVGNGDHTRKHAQEAIDMKISECEWNNIRIHSKWPGSSNKAMVADKLMDLRDARKTGLYVCGASCSKTGHFCRSMFLKEKSLEEHKSKGKCNF